jgi:hypothetical protein
MVHVFVEAAQLHVYRSRSQRWLGDNGIGAQDNEKVTECGSQIAVNTVYRPCTIAARQVTIKKFLNHCLIEPMDVDLAQGRPVRKVRVASNVGTGGV